MNLCNGCWAEFVFVGFLYAFSLAFFISLSYYLAMKITQEQLAADPRIERLLKNPNWRPAAEAAIAYFLRNTACPIESWRKSSTWAQVKMVYEELK